MKIERKHKGISVILSAVPLLIQTGFSVPSMTIGVEFGPEYHPDGCAFIGGRITYAFSEKVSMNFSTTFHEFQSSKRTEGLGYVVVDEFLFIPILNYTLFEKYHFSFRGRIGTGAVLSAHDLGWYSDEKGESHWRGRNDLFPTLVPVIELNYNIPKTTVHLSLGFETSQPSWILEGIEPLSLTGIQSQF